MAEYHVQRKALDQKNSSSNTDTRTVQLRHNSMANIIQMAKINPKMLTQNDVMVLQKTIGNGAACQLINGVGAQQNDTIPQNDEKLEDKDSIQMSAGTNIFQRVEMPRAEQSVQIKKENNTGLPDNLKAGVENLSGVAMDDVRVHYNSDKPVQVGALAYTQGTDIHVAPGQEKHLPHEAWHVVQQAQGRVQATTQMKGVAVNDNEGLEREADEMGKNVDLDNSCFRSTPEGLCEGKMTELANAQIRQTFTLQRMIKNDPIIPVQRKTVKGLSSGTSMAGDNKVYFSDGISTIESYWQMPTIIKNSRAELIAAIAEKAGEIGNEINTKISGHGWNNTIEERTKYDPIRVRFSGQYGLGEQKGKLDLDFHYGSSFTGYVIHVTDDGAGINKEMHNPDIIAALDNGTEYSHIHRIDEDPDGPLEQVGGADNITKLAGEGARWKSIGANAGSLQDNSKIYTNQNVDKNLTSEVRYVTFKNLWKSWRETFHKDFGIPDTIVAEKLEETNLKITTGNGIEDSRVDKADCTTMRHGLDIAVDPEKPVQQADLNSNSISYLHFKKKGSVIESENTYNQEKDNAKAAVDNIVGVTTKGYGGYIGNREFAYLCEVTAQADPKPIVGYTYLEEDTNKLSYPAYRAQAMLLLAKNMATGPTVGKGEELYNNEKTDKYKRMVENLVDEINGCDICDLDKINVEDFVRTEMIPWDDLDVQLPEYVYDDSFEGDYDNYYRPKIETYSKCFAEEQKKRVEKEVEKRIAEREKYFSSKKPREQKIIRDTILTGVLSEWNIQKESY